MDPCRRMIAEVRSTIDRHAMVAHGERILVAVSGGVDSVVLLDVLSELRKELGIELVTAHLDHGLRPESPDDASLVRALACRMGLPFEVGALEPGWEGQERGGLQARAREARYLFLDSAASRMDAGKIALGHNADDQAETVLMRLFRGAGLRGLAGIPPVRGGRYIRPLIETPRSAITQYAATRGLSFVEDSSNRDRRFLRARVRHELLPWIENKINPRARTNLTALAEMLRVDADYIEGKAEEAFGRVVQERDHGRISLSVVGLTEMHEAIRPRVIRAALEASGGNPDRLGREQVREIIKMIMRPGRSRELSLPGGLVATVSYGTLTLGPQRAKPQDHFDETLAVPGTTRFDRQGCTARCLILSQGEAGARPLPAGAARFDLDRLPGPLRVRGRRPGDSFRPVGLGGTKKVKDYLIDLKIPRFQRGSIPLLVSSEKILWVVPHRLDERFLAGPESRRILEVNFTWAADGP